MPEKKDQHYVPQMYFRNFSDNGKSIGGYVLSNRKFVKDMPISGICKRPYLYGDDLQIETWFSGLETKWSPILKKIIRQGNLNLSGTEWSLLLQFIFLSDARTGYTADISNDFTTKLFQALVMTKRDHGDPDFAEYTDEQIKEIKMGMAIPNAAPLHSANKALLFFGDLSPVLIHNTTSRPFITSDNPVVKYNYLFATRNYQCSYGYGHVGIIVFLPISPRYCLMTYDPVAYEVSCLNHVVEINAPNQIIELNKLFATNAKSAVYFHNSAREFMTDKQFWMKADQISDSKKTIEEKADLLAHLLKTAYDENLKMVILYEGDHQIYMNLDDEHPNTTGNRGMLCYTSKRKADADVRAKAYGLHWGYVRAQDILNNLFNKAVIGNLTFNCYSMDVIISIPKETLMKYIPGPYPLPDGLVDVPVSGYPVIPAKYQR